MKSSLQFKTYLSVGLIFIFVSICFAATYTSNNCTNCNWATNGTWSGNAVPPSWGSHTVNVNGSVLLTSSTTSLDRFTAINVNAGKSLTSGSSTTANNLSMQETTLNIYGNVTVYGNLTLTGGSKIIIHSGGSLTVTGTLSLTGSSLTSNSTNNISLGTLSVTGNNSSAPGSFDLSSGSLSVTNGITLTGQYSSLTTSATSGNISAGAVAVNNGTLTVTAGRTMTASSLTIGNNTNSRLNNYGTVTVSGSISQSGAIKNYSTGSITANSLTLENTSSTNLENDGNITINGNVVQNMPITNSSTGVIQINGNLTMNNTSGASLTNSGDLNVTGNVSVGSAARLRTNPGGETYIDGSVTVTDNQSLIVGTSANPPPYADLVIRQNLTLNGGDVLVDRNGRFAVFGNVTSNNNGGTIFTINSGGQVYVDGNMTFNGGGDHVVNNNTSTPYGFYTDGTVTYPGGGSTTGHAHGNVNTMYTEDRPFYDWVSGIPNGPLPIVLLYFKIGQFATEGIELKWVTTFEKNFDYFEIQRAGSDLEFKAIESLKGIGGLNINTPYNFTDNAPLAGKNYYRLKSVDFDGSFEYSEVIYANWTSAKGISVYPNPIVDRKFTVELNDQIDSPAYVELLDLAGSVLVRAKLESSSEEIQISENLKPGLYHVRVFSGSQQKIIKVIVK